MQTKNLKAVQPAQTAKRNNLAEWRAGRLHELTLPSGLTVQATDVTMTDLLFTGKLPPALVEMAKQSGEKGAQELDLNLIANNAQEMGQLMDALVKISVKSPPIAEHGDDEHLGLDEMPGDDKMFIFNWINRESAAVQSFRDETQPVSRGSAGQKILDEAQ